VYYFICSPSDLLVLLPGSETCATGGTALAGNPVTATGVSGSSTQTEATSSPAVTANVVGVWCFRAEYTPDTLAYTASSDATHSECFTVRDSSANTTTQNWLPNDHVVVSTAGGTALTGSLDITLHAGSCTSTPALYTEPTITLTNTASDTGFDTHNTTVVVNAANNSTPYFWQVVFTPAAGSFVDGFNTCTEQTSITIND
jgi:hypothetical protein